MTYLAAFRARNQAIRASQVLSQNGITNRIINTPQRLGIGCGLSINISPPDLNRARVVLSRFSWTAFAGWFSEEGGIYSRI